MGLPPWETSESQTFALITGANSGLGFAIASRLIDEFLTSSDTPPTKHLILILCTRTPLKTRFTISRLRAHLRKLVDYSQFANSQRKKAKAQGNVYKWQDMVARVHFLGVELDLCDLKSVYAVTDKLVNGTVGSPDATTMDGLRLPAGSPGTASYSADVQQDRWALSQKEGSDGQQRSWGWGLSGVRVPRLDVVILNAGIGGWSGIHWPKAIWTVMTDMTEAVTWPTYKLAEVGAVAKSQLSSTIPKEATTSDDESTQPLLKGDSPQEPPLGAVFCSNVFGHYILAHELMPLLSRPASPSATTSGRIIWVSSIEAQPQHFNIDDLQGLNNHAPYESSKRLTDVLVLSRKLRAGGKISSSWFDCSDVRVKEDQIEGEEPEDQPPTQLIKPKMFVVQPGIFVSEIMPLNFILVFFYRMIFYLVRWMGSQWHTIEPYTAAVGPVWLALSQDEILDTMDAPASKWGSATDSSGKERVIRTEVPGWGWEGKTPKTIDTGERRKGRKRDAVPLTREAREDFEVMGVKCWTEMEKLRKEWEELLGVKK
ncbi:9d53616c-0655-437a-b4fa-658335885902 [Sclerotinia trifoliorum]|uniref:9d53616c-0655-437a-b4fa-658335885902 n=1 Tax=Sclerotinia trifoliorum TaxID=28548 RepID=A0A8H2ZL91_9HELO|nr:9d53616c-0655-437a-b4fa-658335885902 [Sclerotinia trifoliorum]